MLRYLEAENAYTEAAMRPTEKLRDKLYQEIVGRLGNLSEGGMLLIAHVPLNDDALYQFRFRLSDVESSDIEVGAHLLWSDRASSPGQFWGGFRFIAMSDAPVKAR